MKEKAGMVNRRIKGDDLVALAEGDKYNIIITGFGDIYEVMSVELLRKRLDKRHGGGILFLASNRHHSGRGMTLVEVSEYVTGKGLPVLVAGYVDSPPWRSNPRPQGTRNGLLDIGPLVVLGRLAIRMLLVVEKFFESERHSHMVYCYAREK